ncbi:MAG: DUF2339 domain-containing protein [Gammaproteobacteria bacterium]|nr:DUF2339 domain-containing protein [Gammaproteobacteria bacterium]
MGVGFLALNLTMIRTVHHWAGVTFSALQLFQSVVLQATLSILWGALALLAMLLGAKRPDRQLWLTGVGLMAIVVNSETLGPRGSLACA